MKRTVFKTGIIFLLLLAVSALYAGEEGKNLTGDWSAKIRENRIQIRLMIFEDDSDHDSITSFGLETEEFQGLQLNKEHTFTLERDAGTIRFDGKFKDDRGRGAFSFVPNDAFIGFLGKEGFGKIKSKELLHLCIFDVNKAYIQDIRKLGYKDVELSELVASQYRLHPSNTQPGLEEYNNPKTHKFPYSRC